YLVFQNPALIEAVHASFLEVGVDVIETDTFGGNRLKLEEYGLGERTYEQNRIAAELARRLADRFSTSDHPRFVAGAIGPSGLLPASEDPLLGDVRFGEVVELFLDQVRGLVDGGVDVLLIETTQDMLELKAVVHAICRAREETGVRVPIQAQVTLMPSGRMLLGSDIAAVLTVLEALPVDIVGLNCSTGPELMREPARFLGQYSTRPVAIIPNAGIPENVNGKAVFPLPPDAMAHQLRGMVEEFGVGLVGGCCGTTPEHLAALVREIGRRPTSARPAKPLAQLASMVRAVDLDQKPAPLIVGERVNTLGSRRVKRLALADDLDGIADVARGQVDEGAHALDVCVATTERTDERDTLRKLVKKLALSVEAPLVLDSTEADVLQDALEQYPGRALVNSINMENGRQRIEAVMPHVVAHGAAVVAMTIDEEGMAKSTGRKAEVARKIYDIVVGEYGLSPEALVYDPLTFPLSTGDEELARSAVETIEGIRRIEAELQGVRTILGISNVSFGLAPAARKVVNAVFLYHAVQAGLDMAIVHPSHVVPFAEIPAEDRVLAEDLVLARRPDALQRLIERFAGRQEADDGSGPDPMLEMSVEARLHYRIVHRKKEGIENDIDEAVGRQDAVVVLNDVLLPAMKEVGDKFGAGELILPFVLQSAEAMKRAVARLETYLDRQEGVAKGTVVLATVFGDVHDIGKNLVNTILTNNGYTVHDLGKQVPVSRIIEKAVETNATAIGLSALLVSTSKQMPLCVKELHRAGLRFPVIIGGAAINRAYAQRTLFIEEAEPYASGVFYAKDAFEGLSLMDRLTDPAARPSLVETTIDTARRMLARPGRAAFTVPEEAAATDGSTVRPVEPPTPPFWGAREMTDIAFTDLWPCLDLKTLFRLHWGGKGLKDEAWERMQQDEFLPRLERMLEAAEREEWLLPRVRYGYYPANREGNDLVVFAPDGAEREIARFAFPRQPRRDRLCLADYFLPLEAGRRDVAIFQIVTMGSEATARTERLQAAGEYAESYFSHGLSVQCAEGLAEYTQRRIRRELGLAEEQGKRYSWGYPSCPDLSQHAMVARLLVPAAIGVRLTDGFQFEPEQTTAALTIAHPDARYFALARSGDGAE
ncbi:MAG: homocysteine S-methyltransferase family protein, partial [Thermomicrobiales bacterium]|nr:homocysteine S-methyltransferase family protein [Thermomicrobiales bacterium]